MALDDWEINQIGLFDRNPGCTSKRFCPFSSSNFCSLSVSIMPIEQPLGFPFDLYLLMGTALWYQTDPPALRCVVPVLETLIFHVIRDLDWEF